MFTRIRVDGKLHNLHHSLPEDFNVIQFQLASAYYGDRANLHFQYSTDGEHWLPAVNDEVTIYRKAPGDFTLQIRVQNDLRGEHFQYIRFPYHIEPHLYERKSFIAGLVVAIAFLLLTVYVLVKENERKKRIKLNEIIRLRTADLEEALADLRTSEVSLKENVKLKENTIKVLAHDVRSPLYAIQFLVRHVQDKFKGNTTDPQSIHDNFSQIDTAISSLIRLSNDFMAWYNLTSRNNQLKLQDVDLVESIHHILELHQSTAVSKSINVVTDLPARCLIRSDVQLIQIVIRNLIDNAIKYTTDQQISVALTQSPEAAELTISNQTGELSEAEVRRIQNLLNDTSPGESDTDSWVGVRLVGFICRRLNYPHQYLIEQHHITFKLTIAHDNTTRTDH